jgi:hypothetical protein
MRVFLLQVIEVLAGQEHRFVNRNGKPAVSTPQHDSAKDEFAEAVPGAAETVRLVWEPD